MGGISSLDFVPKSYKIKYIDSLIPSNISNVSGINETTKGKIFRIMFDKTHTETFVCQESDLTVGWLLSEATRRYDELKEQGELSGPKKHVVGIKSVQSIYGLDYYLTQLENSLSPVKEKTLLAVHYAHIQENSEEKENKKVKVTKNDFRFLKVIGCGGYSNVVLARKKDSGRLYAIKIIKKDAIYMKTNKSVYLSEAAIMKKLAGTPFIVNLHYTFQTENELYFAMDP